MRPCLPTLCYPDVTLSYRAVAVWHCTPNTTLTLAVAQATEKDPFSLSLRLIIILVARTAKLRMALAGARHLSDTVFAGERAVGDRHAAAVVVFLFTLQTCSD